MNMENFPYEVWALHRKLFHRFLKYQKYFTRSTKSLPEYKSAAEVKEKVEPLPTSSAVETSSHVVCLLSSSEEEVSEDDSDNSESSVTEV